jgi:hypothetical protein
VYFSAQIFLFGAEITWVYAQRHGSLKNGSQMPTAAPPLPNRARTGNTDAARQQGSSLTPKWRLGGWRARSASATGIGSMGLTRW